MPLIILSILKIIGKILLIALIVVVILLLIILFWPVQYYADCHIPETDLDDNDDQNMTKDGNEESDGRSSEILSKMTANAGFHWLFHALRGSFVYPGDKGFEIRLFWIKLFPRPEKDSKKKNSRKKKAKKNNSGKDDQKNKKPKVKEEHIKNEKSVDRDTNKTTDKTTDKTIEQSDNINEENSEEKSFKFYYDKLINALNNQKAALKKAIYTISGICAKISNIKNTVEDERFDAAIRQLLEQLAKLLHNIRPRRLDIDVIGGTGDPASTADIMAAYSVIYALSYGNIIFEPDFERKVIGADVHIRGHITICRVIITAAVLYFDKNLKWVIKRIKSEDSIEESKKGKVNKQTEDI